MKQTTLALALMMLTVAPAALAQGFGINTVVVWNRTDCCSSRLNDYWVFVSNTPFLATDTPATLQSRPGTFSSHQTAAPNPSVSIPVGAQGRFVRIQLSGSDVLSLAEVQVLGATNLAQGMPATQSSTLSGSPPAGAAVDGNVDGVFSDGSVTSTNTEANPWWQVDLGVPPPPASCTYTLSANSAIVGPAVSGGTVQVSAPAGCPFTASAPKGSFASIASGDSYTGTASVSYIVTANPGSTSRSTVLLIAGASFTINQLNGCVFGLTPSSASFNAGAQLNRQSGTIGVGASLPTCSFTAASSDLSFIFVSGIGPVLGNSTVAYTVFPNPSTGSRTGIITAAGQTFTVIQAGTACSYALAQASQAFTAAGGVGSVSVQSPAGCFWTADRDPNNPFAIPGSVGLSSSNAVVADTPSGIRFPAAGADSMAASARTESEPRIVGQSHDFTGSGNQTVGYVVPPNPSPTPRTAYLTIAGLTYAITQAGSSPLSCTASAPSAAQAASEGRTELLGDLLLTCTGLTSSLTADISLTLNTNVTNVIGGGATDASLMVDGSAGGQRGLIIGYSTLDWPGFLLVPDGSGTATVRITNVRGDVSLLGVPSTLQSAPVTGTVKVSASVPVPVMNAVQTLAYSAPTLIFQKMPSTTQLTATTIPVQFQETGVAAFHAAAGSVAATRLRVVVSGVPPNVQVFAPVFPSEGITRAQLYSADSTGLGGAPVAGVAGSFQQLPVSGGVATATWVVLAADSTHYETETFPMVLQNPGAADLSAVQMAASLAPVSGVAVASATAPVPRFRDFSVLPSLVNLRVIPTLPTASNTGVFINQVTNDNQVTTARSVTAVSRVLGGTITSCTTTVGSCSPPPYGAAVTVNVGTLAPMQRAIVTVTTGAGCSSGICSLQNDVSVSSDLPSADLPASSSSTLITNAPGLSVGVRHVGNFTQGQTGAAYTITVQNAGAGAGSGTVAVIDTLPPGFVAVTISGAGWDCVLSTLTCTRGDSLAAGSSYPSITLTANVPQGGPSPAINQVNLLGGGSAASSAADSATILAPFGDVDFSDPFLTAIELLREYAITTGCSASPPMFCPGADISRGDMAVFVVRSILGGDNFTFTPTPYFTDVPSNHPEFQWVQKMRDLGITSGCGGATFCPNDPVTRDQMAVFIVRARFGSTTTFSYPPAPAFRDVGTDNPFFPWIQKLKQLGVTSGCGPGIYCPTDHVTREQMAAFLMRAAFNQLLPDGAPVVVSVSPASAPRGLTIPLTLTGQNTNWVNGATQVTTAPGITVTNVVVTSPTTLTAQLVIASTAATGPYSLTPTTGSEEATLPNGFTVTAQ